MPPDNLIELLREIEANTVRASSDGRITQKIGPFLAVAHPTSEVVWQSYAIPLSAERGHPDIRGAVAALREWVAAHKRIFRLEILEPLWPELAPQLQSCGVQLKARMPIMLCARSELNTVTTPQGLVISDLTASAGDAELAQHSRIGWRCFELNDHEPSPQEIAEKRADLLANRYRCAVARLNGIPVGVGSMTVGNDELVGIGTLPQYRGQGVATAISHYLCAQHFARGAQLIWLSAGDDRARQVYDRIGFTVVGDQINLMDPSP
jgi:GNAT superfamily N-acetyltransferase